MMKTKIIENRILILDNDEINNIVRDYAKKKYGIDLDADFHLMIYKDNQLKNTIYIEENI